MARATARPPPSLAAGPRQAPADPLAEMQQCIEEAQRSLKPPRVFFNEAVEVRPLVFYPWEKSQRVIRWGSTAALHADRDAKRQLFLEARGKAKPLETATAARKSHKKRSLKGPGWYVLDTGASVHVVGKGILGNEAEHFFENAPEIDLITCNGKVTSDTVVPVRIAALGGTTRMRVLDDSDPLLSVGQLVKAGCTFAWPPSGPFLITPTGCKIILKVDSHNPVLDDECVVEPPSGGRQRLGSLKGGEPPEHPSETPVTGGAQSSTGSGGGTERERKRSALNDVPSCIAKPQPRQRTESDVSNISADSAGVPDLVQSDDEGEKPKDDVGDDEEDDEEFMCEPCEPSTRDRLIAEANSLEHKLHHGTKNP